MIDFYDSFLHLPPSTKKHSRTRDTPSAVLCIPFSLLEAEDKVFHKCYSPWFWGICCFYSGIYSWQGGRVGELFCCVFPVMGSRDIFFLNFYLSLRCSSILAARQPSTHFVVKNFYILLFSSPLNPWSYF